MNRFFASLVAATLLAAPAAAVEAPMPRHPAPTSSWCMASQNILAAMSMWRNISPTRVLPYIHSIIAGMVKVKGIA